MIKIIASISAILVCATSLNVRAQQVLTLDECKQMAIENNNALKTAQQKIEIANYDKKIAFANYFPKVTSPSKKPSISWIFWPSRIWMARE